MLMMTDIRGGGGGKGEGMEDWGIGRGWGG